VVAEADEVPGRPVAEDRVHRRGPPALVRQHENVGGCGEGGVPDRSYACGAGRLADHRGHGAVGLEEPAVHGELRVEHAQRPLGALAGGEAVEQLPGEGRGAGVRAGAGADGRLDVGADGLERHVGGGGEQHDLPAAAGGDDVVGDRPDEDPAHDQNRGVCGGQLGDEHVGALGPGGPLGAGEYQVALREEPPRPGEVDDVRALDLALEHRRFGPSDGQAELGAFEQIENPHRTNLPARMLGTRDMRVEPGAGSSSRFGQFTGPGCDAGGAATTGPPASARSVVCICMDAHGTLRKVTYRHFLVPGPTMPPWRWIPLCGWPDSAAPASSVCPFGTGGEQASVEAAWIRPSFPLRRESFAMTISPALPRDSRSTLAAHARG
jgi:hypothetical protein